MLEVYRLILLVVLLSLTQITKPIENDTIVLKQNLYLIPGQGADERLFDSLVIDTSFYHVKKLHWVTPPDGTAMKDFALLMARQIDTTQPFSLIGVSLGGMVCTELTDLYAPKKVILISSAKSRNELPSKYKFMRNVPINKVVPPNWYKSGAKIAQPITEPDAKTDKEFFQAMLDDKDPLFLKRTTHMIINWERMGYNDKIVHIHGTGDKTLPIKKVKADYVIDNGSHMMVYTRGSEVSRLVNRILYEIN